MTLALWTVKLLSAQSGFLKACAGERIPRTGQISSENPEVFLFLVLRKEHSGDGEAFFLVC